MTKLSRKWKVLLTVLFTFVLVSAWVAYDPCYCWREPPVWKLWMKTEMDRSVMRLRSGHPGCQVMNLPPEPWPENPSGQHQHDGLDFQDEFRILPGAPDEILLGLRIAPDENAPDVTTHYGKIKYALRVASLAGPADNRGAGNEYLRPASDQEWNAGTPLPITSTASKFAEEYQPYPAYSSDDLPVPYQGKTFAKSNSHYWVNGASVVSPGKSRIAVLSWGLGSVTQKYIYESGPLRIDRPWETYTIDIYDVPTASHLSVIRFWACDGNLNRIWWLGDHLMLFDLGEPRTLVCGFK